MSDKQVSPECSPWGLMTLAERYEFMHFEAEHEQRLKEEKWNRWRARHPVLAGLLDGACITGLAMVRR